MRALHGIKGLIIDVMRLSLGDSKVRVAMFAGTLQPNPIIHGTIALPCIPKIRISLSMTKAALAM